jgi:AcrR family transcriptional regulator
MPVAANRAVRKPASRARRRVRTRRHDTPSAILRAARTVLASVGYARLTMRAVANRAGLTVGNLAYHFPSKRGLVRALIMSLVADYQAKSNEYLRSVGHRRRGGFAGLLRWLVEDSVSSETSRLFRELWVMALHDEVIAEAMDRFYAQAHERVVLLLRLTQPALRRRRAQDIVQLMGAISEGANVLYATTSGQASRRSLERYARLAGALLVSAARNTTRAASSGRRRQLPTSQRCRP